VPVAFPNSGRRCEGWPPGWSCALPLSLRKGLLSGWLQSSLRSGWLQSSLPNLRAGPVFVLAALRIPLLDFAA